jgi:transcriptional regulator with XRE-family HTH domain
MDISQHVAAVIRQLRSSYGGEGISQEALAKGLGTATNTISRWETGVYRPTIEDLEQIARFFGVSIMRFFPGEEEKENEEIRALLRAARQLQPQDLEELRRYAEFRKARSLYGGQKPKAGRPSGRQAR